MTSPRTKNQKARVDLYGERFRARAHLLSPGLQTVARYINEHREVVLDHTAMEIAAATQTSDATVVRAIQALGFAGLRDLKLTMEVFFGSAVSTEEKMSATVNSLTCDVNSSIDFVLQGYERASKTLSGAENRAALAQAVSLLIGAGRVGVFGIGASSILAEYAARLFSRIGLAAYPLNRTGGSLAEQLINLQRDDVLIMMAQNSPHREGMTTLREARRLGIRTILLTGSVNSLFSREAHTVIFVPRGEENGKVPLHGTILVCLEMLVLSVASSSPQLTMKSIKRLKTMYNAISKNSRGNKLSG
ncbi:MurR/RpiR family transcriptional regulator [Affinibrenneria salicis]|uniref:MurR/RpiR family transcriptional regulator n=1 Tax=Affinibrenneria salicis TaxID=2590031 RepID=A0A5J5G1C0_9GAMM|nr:MurR/RpiR family transcriptional regulator [Affinibrenneria salicis]KAA9000514.1 MurR/RpiR family transcriptional regulator [Affinibrenneria salicis]